MFPTLFTVDQSKLAMATIRKGFIRFSQTSSKRDEQIEEPIEEHIVMDALGVRLFLGCPLCLAVQNFVDVSLERFADLNVSFRMDNLGIDGHGFPRVHFPDIIMPWPRQIDDLMKRDKRQSCFHWSTGSVVGQPRLWACR